MAVESKLLTLYSDVTAVPVKWLWRPYIAIGKITLLQGDPGCGKSTMMMYLIAELSKGGFTPDGRSFGNPQRIIYQCSEDGAKDTIKPRLIDAGADCQNIAFIDEDVNSGLTLDDERIRDAIAQWRPHLVVIDPIQSYIGSDSDLQVAVKARKLMRRIGMLASTYKCAVVLIDHFNKKEGTKDLYRGLGSIDVVAAARSVLQVEKCEEDEEVRIVKQIKNSLESNGADLKFEIRPSTGFKWISGPSVINPDDRTFSSELVYEELPKNKHERAALLIQKALENGPVESMEIRRIMAEYCIGDKTMNEVKAELGIKPFRKMRKWHWVLPGDKSKA
jgi:archaellum biogenesis ATPase FlaH